MEPKELENCRYLCQRLYEFFDDYPRTCRKTLDLSSLAIVYGEPVVELFSNTKKNVEKLIMDENSIIKNVEKFFTQLGMSVKELMIGKDSLYAMSDRTFKTVVQKFTHVERLRLDNVYLLYRLQELKLIWKSVKKLELLSAKNWFLLTTKEAVRYNGDFRELPQLKEITLVGLNSKNLNFVKRFAPKIISIEDVDLMQISKTVCDEFLETGLNLIEMDVHFNHPLREQQFTSFFDTQPKLTTLKVQVTSVDHRRWMPSVDFSRITSLHIQLLFERLDLRLIQNLPNLHEFRIQSDNLDIELFDEESACFLTDHRQIDNFSVNFLRIDPLHYDCCMQCLKYLILSFNNVTKLYVNAEPRCGTAFWLPLMVLLQDHKINEKLEVLKMETIRSPYLFDDDIEVDPDIVFGGVFPYFPMLKELVVDYELLVSTIEFFDGSQTKGYPGFQIRKPNFYFV